MEPQRIAELVEAEKYRCILLAMRRRLVSDDEYTADQVTSSSTSRIEPMPANRSSPTR